MTITLQEAKTTIQEAKAVTKREAVSSAQVVIAALNESHGIGLTIAEMKDVLGEVPVLVVDGRSGDRTVEIAKNLGAEVFCQDGVGKGDAIAKAFEHVDSTVDYVVLTDADYTYPAEYVPGMIQILEEHPEVGMVCGNRFKSLCKDSLGGIFALGNKLLALAHNRLNGLRLDDPLTGLRVIRRSALEGLVIKSKGFDVEVELNRFVERRSFAVLEIPIHYRKRLGEKKLKIRDGLTIFKRILLETLVHD
jgi:dolichol-phosphate hexosyltransferase